MKDIKNEKTKNVKKEIEEKNEKELKENKNAKNTKEVNKKSNKEKSNKIKLIIEIVVFIGALCAITGFYYFGDNNVESEEEYEKVGIIKVTDDNYEEEILKSDKPVILEFSSNSCPPCLTMIPTMINIAKNNKDIKVVNVNTSNENTAKITKEFEVEAYPTIYILKDGKVIDKIIGATSEENLLKGIK